MASISGDQFSDCPTQTTKPSAEEPKDHYHTNAVPIKQSGFMLPKTSHDNPPAKFHRFPDLAPELRKSIWQFASHFPRELHVHFTGSCSIDVWGSSNNIRFKTSISKIPGVLHACYESRNEALKFYKKGHYYDDRDQMITSYFNYQIDSLSVSSDALLEDHTIPSERVSMDVGKMIKRFSRRSQHHLLHDLSVFENIQSLSFSLREENLEWLGSDEALQYASVLERLPSLHNLNIILPKGGIRKFATIQRLRTEEFRESVGYAPFPNDYFEEIYFNIRDIKPAEFVAAVKKEWAWAFASLQESSNRSRSMVDRQISQLNLVLLESS